jgi:hypothetical protein
MGALVVYESMFGSTRDVAEAIAAGLEGAGMTARAVEVGEADERVADDVTLLVVGAPTHWLGLAGPGTRAMARRLADDGTVVSGGIGMRQWLAGLDLGGRAVPVAAFSTVLRPNLPGSAARAIARRLRRHGGRLVALSRRFDVQGMTAGLKAGEVTLARHWGASLADALPPQ